MTSDSDMKLLRYAEAYETLKRCVNLREPYESLVEALDAAVQEISVSA